MGPFFSQNNTNCHTKAEATRGPIGTPAGPEGRPMPKFMGNRHYWALLQAPNHGFPAGILHLAHTAPYGLTFVCQNCLGTATLGPFYEHQTMVFLHEYDTWHTRLPMG